MQLPRAPRALVLFALLLPACTIDGLDDLASSGSDDDDESDEEGDTEGNEPDTEGDEDPNPGIESGNEPSSTTQPPPGTESGIDPSETSGVETSGWDTDYGSESGSLPGDASCDALCTLDLTCYTDYASVEECVASCEADAASFGACTGAFGDLNACLGALDCDQYAMFWDALSQINEGVDPGTFPCDYALLALAECGGGGSGGGA